MPAINLKRMTKFSIECFKNIINSRFNTYISYNFKL